MINNYIKKRSKEILEIIIVSEFVSIEQLEKKFGLSRRSVYYEIDKINQWLSHHKTKEIATKRNKGFYLDKETKAKVDALLRKSSRKEEYVFSSKERTKIIYCYILNNKKKVYIEDLCEYIKVSRNTIFTDLSLLKKAIKDYSIRLDYTQNTGYLLDGNPINIRAVFLNYFSELLPMYYAKTLHLSNEKQIDKYYNSLLEIEEKLNVKYVDGILLSLAVLMSYVINSDEKLIMDNININKLKKTNEYKLIEKYFDELNDNEKIYFCIQLLGSRTIFISNGLLEERSNKLVSDLTEGLIDEFEKTACILFDNREDLKKALYLHISSSLYRYQYGVQVGNLMLNDIKNKYKEVFQITKIASRYIEDKTGVPIPDAEVAYLALHFGAFLRKQNRSGEQLRILIVCASGLATGNMIRKEVSELLPSENVIGTLALEDLMTSQSEYDLIISTIKINSIKPVIVVNPILTDIDKNNILNHPLIRKRNGILYLNKICEIAKKYMDSDEYDAFVVDINSYFNENKEPSFDNSKPKLLSLLTKNKVYTFTEEYSWQDAIKKSCESMIKNGSITKDYPNAIINQTNKYDAYMFVAKDIYLAHGKVTDGCNDLDITFNFFEKPVSFSNKQKASLIIVLSLLDQERHLNLLNDILELFSIQTRVEELIKLRSNQEKYAYISSIINK